MTDPTSAPYPQWWIERSRIRKIELDAAVDQIRAIVRTSDDVYGVLVFGSYARAAVGPESDLDFMVITHDPIARTDPRFPRLLAQFALSVPCDTIVYARAEFERLAIERNFVAQARRDGIWIDATAPA